MGLGPRLPCIHRKLSGAVRVGSVQHHDATFYLQLEPSFYGGQQQIVREIRAVGLTQKRPTRQRAGSVVVKLTVRVPDAAFLPLRPQAIVVIPESMATTEPLEVVASDPKI